MPTPTSQAPTQIVAPVPQRAYVESYPTPPPQINTGYFPPVSSAQNLQQQQNPQQRFPQVSQQPQYTQQPAQQQYTPAPTPQGETLCQSQLPTSAQRQIVVPQQQQPQQQYNNWPQYAAQQSYPSPSTPGMQQASPQQSFGPGIATTNMNHAPAMTFTPQYPQPKQMVSPPPTPGAYHPQTTIQGNGACYPQQPSQVGYQ